jgi:hypothetical protein
MKFTTEQLSVVTADQDRVIAEFHKLNAQASSMEGCDPANGDTLTDLDTQMAKLRLLLEASGLAMDEVGQWGPKSAMAAP